MDHTITKICTKCLIEKSLDSFHKCKSREHGYYYVCKLCRVEDSKKHYSRRREHIIERVESYRLKNIDDYKKRLAIFYQKNKEVIKKERKEYYKKNKEQYFIYARNRRAKKLEINEFITKEFIDFIYDKFEYRCFNCSSESSLSLDHHYPLSLGYPLTKDNAVLLCRSCNSSKSANLPEDFYCKDKLEILEVKYFINAKTKD